MNRGWPRRGPRGGGSTQRGWRGRSIVADSLLAIAILLLLGLVAARLHGANTVATTGAVRVVDGDSLEAEGERIRLRGIDAPELSQTCRRGDAEYRCGYEAREAMRRLIAGRPVDCSGSQRDRYQRLLAVCRAGDVELNRAQVLAGWAVAYGGYSEEEEAAHQARRGVWAGDFERPSAWRAEHGDHAEAAHSPPPRKPVWDFIAWLGDTLRGWIAALGGGS